MRFQNIMFTSLVTDGRTDEQADNLRTLCPRLSVWPGRRKNADWYIVIVCLVHMLFTRTVVAASHYLLYYMPYFFCVWSHQIQRLL